MQRTAGTLLLIGLFCAVGCSKKVAVSRPAQPQINNPAPPAAPVATPRHEPAPAVVQAKTPAVSRYPDAATRDKIDQLLSRIQDAYFDYDKHTLRNDALNTLTADAQTLSTIIRQYPDFKLVVEGYCDERGSEEYNLALGDARAQKAKEYLVSLGLPANQMNVISYGKEHQVCTDQTEACWQKNRRAHLTTADARAHQ